MKFASCRLARADWHQRPDRRHQRRVAQFTIQLDLETMKKSPSPSDSRIAEALAKKIPAERIAEVLFEAMAATTTNRAGVTEPNTRCRLQAATLSLAYLEGRPSERSEVIAKTSKMTHSEMIEKMKMSPAFRAEIADMLAKASQ